MHRVLYDTSTGKIHSCRRIPDHMLDKNVHSGMAYLNAFVSDITVKKVNLSTLQIEDVVQSTDWNNYMRSKRNLILQSCDWTQAADSPLTDSKKTEWQTYRQQLRDLPATLGSISSQDQIVWPTKPE